MGQEDTSLAWLKIVALIVALVLLTVGAIFVLEAKRKILFNMQRNKQLND